MRIEQGGASTITHLLALQGVSTWPQTSGSSTSGPEQGTLRRAARRLARPLNAPDLGWSFPTGQDACGWEAGVRYPAQGRSGPLWRPRPPAAQ